MKISQVIFSVKTFPYLNFRKQRYMYVYKMIMTNIVCTLCICMIEIFTRQELVMARITLKNIETLTYNFTETEMEQAKALSADLDELYSKYHALLPKRQGILLRPNANVAIQYMRRKIQRAKFTLRCSTIKRSKPKRLKASSRRVGAKADRLRKLWYVGQ